MSVRSIRQCLRTVFSIERRESTGILDVRSEADRALLYFRQGTLVMVEQSSLGRTIGAHLVERGLLGRRRYREIAAAVAQAKPESPLLSFMERTIQEGVLEPSMASAIVSAQVERNFILALGWESDYCRFQASDAVLEGQPVFPCSLQVVVLEGLRQYLGPAEKAELLARYGPRTPRLTASADEVAREFRLQPREERFLRQLVPTEPLEAQIEDPEAPEVTLVVALYYSGRLAFTRTGRQSLARIPIIKERPRHEKMTTNRVRLTLPRPPSDEEVDAAAAFQRGKRLLPDDPHAAREEFHRAVEIVTRPDYVLYAVWADYTCADAETRREMLPRVEDATRRALEDDATSAFAYFVVGQLYLSVGERDSALYAFERAHSLDPTDLAFRFTLDAIREGRDETA